eukprot:126341_1
MALVKSLSELFKMLRIKEEYLATEEAQFLEIGGLFTLSPASLVKLVPEIGPRNRLKKWIRQQKKNGNDKKYTAMSKAPPEDEMKSPVRLTSRSRTSRDS